MSTARGGSSIFEWKTLTVCLSLLCLPILFTAFVFSLPLLLFVGMILYLSAWLVYLVFARTDSSFNLPYNPSRVIKVDWAVACHVALLVSLLPHAVTHFVWRYWKTGPSGGVEGVRRDVPYINDGDKDHTYDLYLPVSLQTQGGAKALVPVMVFLYGGAWASGSKNLYGLLANMLRRMGYIVVVPNYRKYPTVKVEGIYDDVRAILETVGRDAESWGGDPGLIFVAGHSAGAHLAAQVTLSVVVDEARKRAEEAVMMSNNAAAATGLSSGVSNGKVNGLHVTDLYRNSTLPHIEGLILIAGVYDIPGHYAFETSRGVEKVSAMGRVMATSFEQNSPLRLLPKLHISTTTTTMLATDDLRDAAMSNALAERLPRIMLVHGEKDFTVPVESTLDFYKAVGDAIREEHRGGVDVRVRLYKRMGHTEVITALMPNLFFRNRSAGSLVRDLKEFVEPEMFEDSEDDI